MNWDEVLQDSAGLNMAENVRMFCAVMAGNKKPPEGG